MQRCILILSLMTAMLPFRVLADDTPATSGSCAKANTNSTCFWTYDATTDTLKITGSGQMSDYSFPAIPWFEYKDQIKNVMIADGITSIGKYAFYTASNLESVDIPDSVEQIKDFSFARAPNLTEIRLPNNPNFTTISDYTFSHSGLTSVDIPQSVTFIGDWAFSGCSNLKNILISDNVNFIDHGALNALSQDVKIYCRQGANIHNGKTCDELVDEQTLYTGGTITYKTDNNGYLTKGCKKYVSFKDFVSGNYIKKRIYTIEEANEVAGKVNRVSIKYR